MTKDRFKGMNNLQEAKVLGAIELSEMEATLIEKWCDTILEGTIEEAFDAYQIIFETEPSEDDLYIFKLLCIEFWKKKHGYEDHGIKGVIRGGKDESN